MTAPPQPARPDRKEEMSMGHRDMAQCLLEWYDAHRRVLPWRAAPGVKPDPYRVWLAEVMLQQTTVRAVVPYFHNFVARWPVLEALAVAPLNEILKVWAGLGYYARARNLHKCANEIMAEHGGLIPDDQAQLLALPGIGPYSAAAIAAIAFDKPAVVVDGNVERVMARLNGVETPLPEAKPRLRELAGALSPDKRAGDYAQAVMDLGAVICTPRAPDCANCPWAGFCAGHASGLAQSLPRRSPKKLKPRRKGVVFWVESGRGQVLIRTRPAKGLLGGMSEVPSSPWLEETEPVGNPMRHAPVAARWRKLVGVVRHSFTHFHLELEVWAASLGGDPPVLPARGGGWDWADAHRLGDYPFPSVMKKVIAHARADRTD